MGVGLLGVVNPVLGVADRVIRLDRGEQRRGNGGAIRGALASSTERGERGGGLGDRRIGGSAGVGDGPRGVVVGALRGIDGGTRGVYLAVEPLIQRVLGVRQFQLRGLDLVEGRDFLCSLGRALAVQLALGGGGVERGELLVSFDPLADFRVERDNGTRLRRGERDLARRGDGARCGHGLRDVLRRDGRDIGGGEHHAVGAEGEVVGTATARSEDGEGGGGEGDSLLFHYS
ncbi:hypothetical protein [Corynebacterium striatum]|uniref:hypothetical protein n=1 Tax=Corynebacterium striatum TaxID=43770 RepID=UPI001559D031|nr:hypothetical protein [Corynebacterium striatum]